MNTPKPTDENLGCWNAFVAEGKTREERKARLMMAPEKLRGDIKNHVILCFNLKNKI